ncbi:MAG: M50 family metallopeptidase [Solirubrobacteraceae bacterium]
MSWALTILGIAALIVLHELGHFAVAKAVGMRVERFSLFFPPKLVGIRRGETEYMIGAIPAGGYVKITGMSPQEIEGLEPQVARRAYYNQPPWKRIVVILAGPGVNLAIAFLVFWAILFAGSLDGAATLENLNPSIQTRVPSTTVAAIEQGEPAVGVLMPGDRILTVDGRRVTVASAMRAIAAHRCAGAPREGCRAATPVQLTVRRAGRVVLLSVYPRYSAAIHRMLIGFGFGAPAKHFGALGAAGAALGEMWGITAQTLTNIGHAFTSAKVRHQFSSIVGITVVTQEAVVAGAGYALVILGFVSLVLAVINLFPFLPLDGGHVLWSVAEKVRGRRVSLNAMWRFSSIGIVLLAFLVINGFSNDISRLGG